MHASTSRASVRLTGHGSQRVKIEASISCIDVASPERGVDDVGLVSRQHAGFNFGGCHVLHGMHDGDPPYHVCPLPLLCHGAAETKMLLAADATPGLLSS